jgi:predicted transcriptional regulator of viral defense system
MRNKSVHRTAKSRARSQTDRVDSPLVRSQQLEESGVSRSRIRTLVDGGALERVSRGLYRVAEAELTEHYTVLAVCARVPRAIICLLTALQIYGIGTQSPKAVWIALDRKARKPQLGNLPVRIVRFSGPALAIGVVSLELDGIGVRITSPARTVVDCFRYRNKLGLDVALEALREAIRSRHATVDEINRIADACRARTIIGPYFTAVLA